MLLGDGWLRTGDIVRVSSDGFVTIVDRVKELIITGGFNVAPSEVEQTPREHPTVADAAAVGLPSGGGEIVAVAVILTAVRNSTSRHCAAIVARSWPPTRCRGRSSRSTSCPGR